MFATAGLGGTGTVRRSRLTRGRDRRGGHQLGTENAQRSVGANATRSNSASDHRQEHQPPRHDAARQLSNTSHRFILSWQFITSVGCGSCGKVTSIGCRKLERRSRSLFFRVRWLKARPPRTNWQGEFLAQVYPLVGDADHSPSPRRVGRGGKKSGQHLQPADAPE